MNHLVDKELAQRALVNSLMLRWRPAMSGVLQRSGISIILYLWLEMWNLCGDAPSESLQVTPG